MFFIYNIHEILGIFVTLPQHVMHLHAAMQGFYVKPGLGLQFDPIQPLFHAPPNLFVQPGRRLHQQAVPPPRGDRVNRRRAWGFQKNHSFVGCVASILTP